MELSGISLFKIRPEGKAPLSIQQTAALKEFSRNTETLKTALTAHVHAACRKARQEKAKATQIEVMMRTKEFQVITERAKLPFASNQETEILPLALQLLLKIYSPFYMWRSVGITLSGLIYNNHEQADLFTSPQKSDERLGKALDELEQKFGKNIVYSG